MSKNSHPTLNEYLGVAQVNTRFYGNNSFPHVSLSCSVRFFSKAPPLKPSHIYYLLVAKTVVTSV